MKKLTTGWLAVLVALVAAGSLQAHHSLANFDTTKAVRVKGTVVKFHEINPHSFIILDQKDTDSVTRRWAIEGPSLLQLKRRGVASDVPKPGDVVEVCGYAPRETIVWQIASSDPAAPSLAGRLLNAETLVMADGKERSWGDYGFHKCFAPEFKDQHSR
jgi:hypothetical protein